MPAAMRRTNLRFMVQMLFAIALFTAARMLPAQSKATADKAADISVFAGYQYTNPDIGKSTDRGNGVTVGVDFTRYFKSRFVPSIEARGTYASAPFATESTALGGLRLKVDLRQKFHPYADFLIGGGRIVFTTPPAAGYTRDTSIVYSYGGGIDIDVHKNFAAKFDFQEQSWNMGPSPSVTGVFGANFTLAPMVLTVGVNYHIPFRPHIRQDDVSHY